MIIARVLGLLPVGLSLATSPLVTEATESKVDLRVGIAQHAFEHLGNIGEQAPTAAASGSTIIYVSGIGALGYGGLSAPAEFTETKSKTRAYFGDARRRGINGIIGYICATSIVKLGGFDKNWPEDLRSSLKTAPREWLQQDKNGKPLPSWYGGDYSPACMNNPDWLTYEKYIVREQLELGCDGVFFDNPTVHPEGCYCPHCMEGFSKMLIEERMMSSKDLEASTNRVDYLRQVAGTHTDEFRRFRCKTAATFFAEIRKYARRSKPGALITANNSLNSSDVLYAQCRNYAYNIYEMSKTEDFVVVEDMGAMPRALPNGETHEYAPTYKQLLAISHGKPVVAVTLAESDYHTPAQLVRLAMAEATANGAGYLGWPTWPENQRERMIETIRPQADFLRTNATRFEDSRPRADVTLFLPFRNWLKTGDCKASRLAAELSRQNIQYQVVCEDDLTSTLKKAKYLLTPSLADFSQPELREIEKFTNHSGKLISADNSNWLPQLKTALGEPSLQLSGPATVRAVVTDSKHETLVHLLNLNVQRISSFEDKVTPASHLKITVTLPRKLKGQVQFLSADFETPCAVLNGEITQSKGAQALTVTVPKLQVSALLLIQ
jgi:hypothetical protein